MRKILIVAVILFVAAASLWAINAFTQAAPTLNPANDTADSIQNPNPDSASAETDTITTEKDSEPVTPIDTSANITPAEFADERPPGNAANSFSTDFSRHTVSYQEILSGGPPKDGIPAIDDPKFIDVSAADAWLQPQEPVIFFQVGDDARAYPLQILTWHEIANDEVGGQPVTITFCPCILESAPY